MTSVPKPLKFLRPRYAELKATFEGMPAGDIRSSLANVLSVLAMNSGAEGAREALNFRLAGTPATASSWGHEYIRCTREFQAPPGTSIAVCFACLLAASVMVSKPTSGYAPMWQAPGRGDWGGVASTG